VTPPNAAPLACSPAYRRVAVVPATLITDYETGVGMPDPSDLDAIQSALEWAAVEFTNGGQPGVRMRKSR
jgi:hypothetical protein